MTSLKLIDAHFHLSGAPASGSVTQRLSQLTAAYEALGIEFLGGIYVEDVPVHEDSLAWAIGNGDDREFARELAVVAKKTYRPDRVMYASNWPQINDAGSLETHITLLDDVFGADPRFWRENAMRCYGITLREGRKAA